MLNAKQQLTAILILFALSAAACADGENHTTNSPAETEKVGQQTCPVIPQNKIDPNIFTEYKGEKVYFCCTFCRAAFLRNPGKYPVRPLQFAQSSTHTNRSIQHRWSELTLAKFIKPMGIITLSLLTLTVMAGLFRRKMPKFLLGWHKRLGITTLASAIIHLILVLIAH
ncbi:MAG TPA: hypothetical protein ENH34_07140 [Phycisphaerales bacterium]|nr:hypothetical protein [Phycisphaerales bacterium]